MPISQHGFEYGSRHVFSRALGEDEDMDPNSEASLDELREKVTEMSKSPLHAGKPYETLFVEAVKWQFKRKPKLALAWKKAPGSDRS